MVTPFNILTPGNIRFGRGQARSAAPWLAQYDAPVLLVHGATKKIAPNFFTERTDRITSSGQHFLLSPMNPRWTILNAAYGWRASAASARWSASAAARSLMPVKAIAALVPASGPAIDYLEVVGTGRILEASPLPFVAIPTTSGTGAEVTKKTRSSTSRSSSAKSACATIACCRSWRLSIQR